MADGIMAALVRRAWKLFHLYAYAGRGQLCVVCGRRSARFATFGMPPRAKARCVRCNSLERHRFMWLYLREVLGVVQPQRVLHFAPEPFLAPKISQVAGVEYVTTDLELGRGMVAADITNLPFANVKFDLVICSHVLEHIPDDAKAIGELFRVLKPGGSALIMVPLKRGATEEDVSVTDPLERIRRFGQVDHVRFYGDDFVARLAAGGFVVDVVCPGDVSLHTKLAELGIPVESERIFRAQRPAT